jgi:hypothetical protein
MNPFANSALADTGIGGQGMEIELFLSRRSERIGFRVLHEYLCQDCSCRSIGNRLLFQ